MKRESPPRICAMLLRLLASPEDRGFLAADASEEFERIRGERGTAAARAWYRQQTRSSLRPLAQARLMGALRRLSSVRRLPDPAADLAQGFRWIRRHPATAVTAGATLAVAFAAATATWTIVASVLLRPLPFRDADRIVAIRATGPGAAPGVHATSGPDFEDWRERATAFAVLSAWAPDQMRFTGHRAPEELDVIRVERHFDRVFGITPFAGRFFNDADYVPTPRVAVLTHEFWRQHLASNPTAVGSLLSLNDRQYEIVGILPDLDTRYPVTRHALWIPLVPREGAFWERQRGSGWLSVVGRVRESSTREQGVAELTTIIAGIAQQHPGTHANRTMAELTPVSAQITGPVAPVLWLLAAALGAVLIIACGNVANLLLASTAGRRREFAVRAAIGAGRSRLARQVFSESLLLCAGSALAALALSPLLVRGFLATYPGVLPRAVSHSIEPSGIAAAVVLAVVGGFLLGVPLAIQALAARIGPAAATARVSAGVADRTLRTSLVAAQIALSFLLIVAGWGFVRTLDRLARVDTGYEAEGVLTFSVPPPTSAPSAAEAVAFYDEIVQALEQMPEVRRAAAAIAVPMMTGGWRFGIRPPGASADVLVGVNLTTDGYFDALGIRLREGRRLTVEEQRRGTAVAVVNQRLATLLGGRVVGTRLRYSGQNWEIVGVVDDVRHGRPRDEPLPEFFIPWHMAGRRMQTIVVKTSGDPLALLPAIASRVHAIDPTAPLTDAGRLADHLQAAVSAERFRARLVTALALIALALAGVGAYSVTACAVARRTREYGIRMALGERPRSIAARALSAAVGPAALGVVAGAVLAWYAASWIESFLYGVRPATPAALAASAAALVALAGAAGSTSARRATRIDPASALQTGE